MRLLLLATLLANIAHAGPGVWTTTGPNGGGLSHLATSASSPATVYVATGFSLFRSTDSGVSFARRAAAQDLGYINDLVVSPANVDVVYLLSDSGVMKSINGGGSFAPASSGLPTLNFFVRDLAMDPSTPDTLILTSASHGAFRTTDGGSNWAAIGTATLPTHLSQVAIDPGSPSRVLISPCAPDDGSPYAGAHLYRSTDGGTSFSPVTVTALAPGAATCTAALAFSSTSAGVVLGVQGFGPLQPSNLLLRSTDSGATFTASSPGPASTLLISSFNFVAGAPNEVLAANARGAFRRSVDDGLTFPAAAASPVLPGPSPALESQVVTSKPGDASVRYFISRGAGFFRSTDSGVTWTESNLGNTSVNARAIAVNPSTPSTIYVGQGESEATWITWPFYRSSNAGGSWAATGSAFSVDWLRALLVDSNTSGAAATTVIYGAGRDLAPVSVAPPLRASGVVKSSDNGNTWTNLNTFAGLGGVAPSPAVSSLGTLRAIVPDRSVITSGAWSKLYVTASGNGNCSTIGGSVTITTPRLWLAGCRRQLEHDQHRRQCRWRWQRWFADRRMHQHRHTCRAAAVGGFPDSRAAGRRSRRYQHPVCGHLPAQLQRRLQLHAELSQRHFQEQRWRRHLVTGIDRIAALRRVGQLALLGAGAGHGSEQPQRAVCGNQSFPRQQQLRRQCLQVDQRRRQLGDRRHWSGRSGYPRCWSDPDILRIYAASGGNALNPGGVFVSEDGGTTWNSISAGLPVTSATALALDNTIAATPTLYAGSRTGVYAFTRVLDPDGDGAPSTGEAGAPNGGDGNGDGLPDSGQSSVASLPGTAGAAFRASLPFTVSVTPLSGSCTRLYDVIAVPADTFGADPMVQKPDGAFRFEIANCASARVHLKIHGGSFAARSFIRALGARVQGDPLSIGWNTLGASIVGDTISFTLTDNQPGDARQDVNRMLFQGGPAFEVPLFGNGFE
ncbi:MAG: hypothetical protein IPO66_20260 [Rhodanobacteraceae bacterium]|nr:hypothetical protein [Rhodanobacteraceae bacterium]